MLFPPESPAHVVTAALLVMRLYGSGLDKPFLIGRPARAVPNDSLLLATEARRLFFSLLFAYVMLWVMRTQR
jgi:hypothetical protein